MTKIENIQKNYVGRTFDCGALILVIENAEETDNTITLTFGLHSPETTQEINGETIDKASEVRQTIVEEIQDLYSVNVVNFYQNLRP
jgi:hypothetical protein